MHALLVRLFALGLLVLSGCAGQSQQVPGEESWQAREAQLARLDHWTASGKIALRTAEQAESASLLWQQMGEATHLRLSGPLGVSATTVDSDGHQLEVRQGDDYSRWNLDDPNLAQPGGWDLPLRSMHYWLKGIPDPDLAVESLQLDEPGQLPQLLQQQGWTVEYQQFSRFDDYRLPTKLRVFRGETQARILLRNWADLTGS